MFEYVKHFQCDVDSLGCKYVHPRVIVCHSHWYMIYTRPHHEIISPCSQLSQICMGQKLSQDFEKKKKAFGAAPKDGNGSTLLRNSSKFQKAFSTDLVHLLKTTS